MRCAHPDELVPQWPSDNNSVNHVRRKRQCASNSERLDRGLELIRQLVDGFMARAVANRHATAAPVRKRRARSRLRAESH